jgi:hypothetical protein
VINRGFGDGFAVIGTVGNTARRVCFDEARDCAQHVTC